MRPVLCTAIFVTGLVLSLGLGGFQPKLMGQPIAQRPPGSGQGNQPRAVSVDVGTAETGSLTASLRYTGTTQPLRQVTLRTRTEGLLVDLEVDIGDQITKDDVLGRVDPTLLESELIQAKAQLAAEESQVAQAKAELSTIKAQVEQARLNWLQQQADAERLQQLASEGAISTQQAEQAETAAQTALQALRSAEEQVRTQDQAIIATRQQVDVQKSLVAQAQERLSYTQLLAPISGVVVERLVDPGVFLSAGDDVLILADFTQIKVEFELSELDLSKVAVGQRIELELDAFAGETFVGQITRISPAADPDSRVIPVEVQIPNLTGRIGSGFLARVQLVAPNQRQVVVPETAIQEANGSPTVFVIDQQQDSVRVSARAVELGTRRDGQVEVRTGLQAGEPYVVRSSAPLTDGQEVQLSILSKQPGS